MKEETAKKQDMGTGSIPKLLAQLAIPGCAIRCLSAADAREQVENTAGIDLTQFGGELPADDFYYGAQ